MAKPPYPLDFETIYQTYYKSVYRYIYGQILHRETAEDLTADVFVAAATHLGQFDPARGNFAPWLFTIARNLTRNYLLRASTRREVSREEPPERSADASAGRDDSLRAPVNVRAERILARLSPEERRLLELRYTLDLTNEEIGRIVGATAAAVSQRFHRLLAKCSKIDKEA